jgi:hypothetical protein
VQEGASKRSSTNGTGHQAVIDLYDRPTFPDGDAHTYMDLARAAGMVTALEGARVSRPPFCVVCSVNAVNYTRMSLIIRNVLFFLP